MRKKFVTVMLYGALALTTSTSLVGCKDYDDDVKNLQEQIDHITKGNPVSTEEMKTAIASAVASLQSQLDAAVAGKADNAAVVALQQKVQELVNELNGKADEARLTALADEIKALSDQVNSVKGSLEETKTALEAEIASLKQQLENTADKSQMEQLAKDLAALQNKLDDVAKATEDNAATIIDLKTKIAELQSLVSRIEALEKANEEFATRQDLSAYTKTTEMAELIDNRIATHLKDGGAIAKYVNDVITAKITAEVTSINNRLDTFQSDLDALADKLNEYTANGEITGKIQTLSDWKAELLQALTDAKFKDFADLFKQINDLKDSYGNCVTKDNIGEILAEEMKKNDTLFGQLAEEVEALRKEVDALKGMIQSIVFIPTHRNGEVLFTTLKVNGNDGGTSQIVARSGNTEVKFRISPAKLAQSLVDGKYTVNFDAQVLEKTRATGIFEVVGPARLSQEPGEEGIVIYTLKANRDKSYAVCLKVSDKYTDLSSDYFPAISQDVTLTDAKIDYVAGKEPATKIYWDTENSSVDFGEAGTYTYRMSVTEDGQNKTVDPETYGMDGASIFTNEYSMDGNNTADFNLTPKGLLKLKSYKADMDGKSVEVYSTLTISTLTGYSYKTSLGAVTAAQTSSSTDVAYTASLEWNGMKEQPVYCPLKKIAQHSGITIAELESGFLPGMTTEADNGVTFAQGSTLDPNNEKALKVLIPEGLKAGMYAPKAVLKSGARTIHVTATVQISYPQVADFIKSGKLWTGDNVGITPVYDNKDNAARITLRQDLTNLFSNYADIRTEVGKAGGTVAISSLLRYAAGVTLDAGGLLEIDVTEYVRSPFKCVAIASFGNHAAKTQAINVSPAGLSGTWKNGKTSVKFANKMTPVKLLDGFSWSDARGKKMWADGTIATGDNKNGFATGINPLDLYGLAEPSVTIVDSEYSGYFEYNAATNTIAVKESGQSHLFTEDVPVQVKVSVASKWEDLKGDLTGNGGTVTLTVTLPADK